MKEEATVQTQAYQLTQDELDAITNEAWAGEGCQDCQDILQHVEIDDGKYALYPTPSQAEHMQGIFGYEADPIASPTGYLDPNDPNWQRSKEHIQERQKDPENQGSFGPQSGMTRGEPTRDEWQITSYLDHVGVPYVHKMKLGELDPSVDKPMVEFDIYVPEFLLAIETSPSWHEGGSHAKSFPRVTENDQYKAKFAKEHGIDLISFDPAHGTEKFINEELVPRLRSVGVDAFEVHQPKEKEEVDPNQAFIDKHQVEKFGPVKIADLQQGGFLAQCEEHEGDKFASKDYDEVADWVTDHLAVKHRDEMYSPTMNPGTNPEGLPIGYTIDEIKDLREEDVAAPIVEKSGDFYTHKPLDNIDTETGEESPMQTDYGYSHKYDEGHYPDEGQKGQGYQKGNPFNQQYIYREENELASLADEYNEEHGLGKIQPVDSIKPLDESEIEQVATIYDERGHDPSNPEVQASYVAFIEEFTAQYDLAKANGITFDFTEDDPYPDYKSMQADMQENKHMAVYTAGNPLPEDHPLATETPEGVSYNSIFRGVHDLFGHLAHDFTFDNSEGEFHAFQSHLQMFSPEARGALAQETLAQTCWYEAHGQSEYPPQDANIFTEIPQGWIVQEPQKLEAGYDWDYNVPYRTKPILEEQTAIKPQSIDQSQNYPLYPQRGKVNTAEPQVGGESLDFPNHLFMEEESEDDADFWNWMESNIKDEGDGFYSCNLCDMLWHNPTTDKIEWHFALHHPDMNEKPRGDIDWGYVTLGEQEEEAGPQWQNPNPNDERREYKEALLGLANESADEIMGAVQEGSISQAEGDDLMTMQTKVKELTMDGNREEALIVLFQMADKLAALIASRDNLEEQ